MESDVNSEQETMRLNDRIASLETRRRNLADGLAEADHQVRRERDGLERAGGRAPGIEGRLSLLDEGCRLTRKALEEVDAELARARMALQELERE